MINEFEFESLVGEDIRACMYLRNFFWKFNEQLVSSHHPTKWRELVPHHPDIVKLRTICSTLDKMITDIDVEIKNKLHIPVTNSLQGYYESSIQKTKRGTGFDWDKYFNCKPTESELSRVMTDYYRFGLWTALRIIVNELFFYKFDGEPDICKEYQLNKKLVDIVDNIKE